MTKFEKIFLEWVDKQFFLIVVVFFLIIGGVIRISLFNIESGDYNSFLMPWYEMILKNGLAQQVGDYNFTYQFIIWIMTKLHIPPLYGYKSISCVFDLLLAMMAAIIVYQNAETNKQWKGIAAYSAVWLSPIVFLNSAAWAQCDAIYSFFVIWALLYLSKEKYIQAFCTLGVGFAFKLHAIFILPFFLFVYFVKRKFTLLQFVWIPVMMLLFSSPLILWGRNLFGVFKIYVNQTSSYQAISMNYPSIWNLLCQRMDNSQYINLKIMTIGFTICILAMIMVWWIQQGYQVEGKKFFLWHFY